MTPPTVSSTLQMGGQPGRMEWWAGSEALEARLVRTTRPDLRLSAVAVWVWLHALFAGTRPLEWIAVNGVLGAFWLLHGLFTSGRRRWGDAEWLCLVAATMGAVEVLRLASPVATRVAGSVRAGLDGCGLMWREAFSSAISSIPGRGAGLFSGMSVGIVEGVSSELADAMRQASVGHLTAVSGANCSIVVGFVMGVASWLGAGWRSRHAIGALSLVGFVALVGFEASVVRASFLLLIVLLGRFLGRPAGGVPALAAGVIVGLVLFPDLARSTGYCLSVAATAGILLLQQPLESWGRRSGLPRVLVLTIATTVAAQAGCLPLLVALGSPPSLGGVAANVLIAPVTAWVTLFGVAACLCAPSMPGASQAFAFVMWPLTEWVAIVAEFFARFPVLSLVWPSGSVGIVLAVAACAFVTLATVALHRAWVSAAAAVILAMGVGLGAGAGVAAGGASPSDWSMAVCDIGQGDALLFRVGEEVVAVDAGPDPALMAACRDQLQIDAPSTIVITHWDHDHYGGVAALLSEKDDQMLVSSRRPDAATTGMDPDRWALAAEGEHWMQGGISMEVLWPRTEALGEASEKENDRNAASLVLLIRVGGLTILALGDAGREEQRRIAAELLSSGVGIDVVKVAHHGSADAWPSLYGALRPQVAVVSVGAGNGYGHPAPSVVNAVEASSAVLLRTDRDGMILLTGGGGGGGGVRAWCSRGCGASR